MKLQDWFTGVPVLFNNNNRHTLTDFELDFMLDFSLMRVCDCSLHETLFLCLLSICITSFYQILCLCRWERIATLAAKTTLFLSPAKVVEVLHWAYGHWWSCLSDCVTQGKPDIVCTSCRCALQKNLKSLVSVLPFVLCQLSVWHNPMLRST